MPESVEHGDEVTAARLSWPRRVEDGVPIVGWVCQTCDCVIEAPYKPSLLCKCPTCGGNEAGVRRFEPEPFVEGQRRRLHQQLMARFGPTGHDGDPTCAVCGIDEEVHVDPGDDFTDLQWRCDDHRRFEHHFWWQPGDHPSLLTRQWIETCDTCGAEFTEIFGVTFATYDAYDDSYKSEDQCLQCADPEEVARVAE